jgi:hypothetical protein
MESGVIDTNDRYALYGRTVGPNASGHNCANVACHCGYGVTGLKSRNDERIYSLVSFGEDRKALLQLNRTLNLVIRD